MGSMGMETEENEVPYNYNIIDTDYENFALVYSCLENWAGTNENLWILGRTP